MQLSHPCTHTRTHAKASTRAHRHGPSQWTSFGTSSSDQLDLFCFLNTYRCSAAKPSSLTSSTICKAAALHAHITISLFPRVGRVNRRAPPACCYTYRRTQAYILLLHTRPCAYMSSPYIYICIHTITITFAHIYIYEHIATRAHTHITLYCYMCTRIYTHNYTYII